MPISPYAGKPAEPALLINLPQLVTAYYTGHPDPSVPAQRVVFGTSGHRGSSLDNAFNEAHILAITQAICRYRQHHGIDGPLFIGRDTHALSEPAFASALEVLAANGVEVMIDAKGRYTPTPVVSHAILTHNRGRTHGLAELRAHFDVACASDTDADRHGIVSHSQGLLNPNQYLAVAIAYLFANRPQWPRTAAVGKTVVSSSLIDRVAAHLGRRLVEVPVGFKWFVDGLLEGALGFGGEESSGATFLRRDGTVWTTDKDGLVPNLLAAEITAKTGREPGEHYRELTRRFGEPWYERLDAPVAPAQKQVLERLSPQQIQVTRLAGEKIQTILTAAPGNGAPIGGIKVIAEHGWFAARPSGTEEVYKIYAESFQGEDHLRRLLEEAQVLIDKPFAAAVQGQHSGGTTHDGTTGDPCINNGSSSDPIGGRGAGAGETAGR